MNIIKTGSYRNDDIFAENWQPDIIDFFDRWQLGLK